MRFHIGHLRSGRTQPAGSPPRYYHYHLENPDTDVVIAAWQCPVPAPANGDAAWFERNCTLPLEHGNFDISTHQNFGGASSPALPIPLDPEHTHLEIIARPENGYGQDSRAMCDIVVQDREHESGGNRTVRCNWYTWQRALAKITVYAWECPDGYDFMSEFANPMEDCVGLSRGVHYRLSNCQPEDDRELQTSSERASAARFDGLQPGEYTLAEVAAAEGNGDTILWQCFGVEGDGTQATKAGTDVSLVITGGEHITCHRFHIP